LESLEVLGELNSLRRGDPLMDVVKQLDFVAELFAALLEQLQDTANVIRRLEYRALMQRGYLRRSAPRSITRHAGHAYLHAHVTESGGHELAGAVDRPRDLIPLRMGIAVHSLAAFPAQQLIDRQSRLAAFDVP